MTDNNDLRRQMLALQRKVKAAEGDTSAPAPTAATDPEAVAARAREAMARRAQQGAVAQPVKTATPSNMYDEDEQKLVSDNTKAMAAAAAMATANASRLVLTKAREGATVAMEKARETKRELDQQPGDRKRRTLVWSALALVVIGSAIGSWFAFKPNKPEAVPTMPVIPPVSVAAPIVPEQEVEPVVEQPPVNPASDPFLMPMISPGAIEAEAARAKEQEVQPAPEPVQEPVRDPTPEPTPTQLAPVVEQVKAEPPIAAKPRPQATPSVQRQPVAPKQAAKKPDPADPKLKEVDDFFGN